MSPHWDARVDAWRMGTRPDGRAVWVVPLTFTHAILLGPPDDVSAYDDRYHTRQDAMAAAGAWLTTTDPEPTGWHRHPDTGRRRPTGDRASEYMER